MTHHTQTIVALDFDTREELFQLLDAFQTPIYVKLGMEAIYSFGTTIIEEIKSRGHRIFLDLKLHDIPNTVYHAMKQLAHLNVDMINVHAGGGIKMMAAAAKAVKEVNPNMICIAVTILTSLDEETVRDEMWIDKPLREVALHYARNAKIAGLDGVVCSVHEVSDIHALCGEDFLTVTPGIALADTKANDQKRVATPLEAKQLGSDYIVVGRAITKSKDPVQTYQNIQEDLTK